MAMRSGSQKAIIFQFQQHDSKYIKKYDSILFPGFPVRMLQVKLLVINNAEQVKFICRRVVYKTE